MERLYYPLSDYLKERFGGKVFKVSINAGFTCPNRDGTKGYGGCIYCESSTLSPKGYDGNIDVRGQIEAGICRVRKRHKAEKFIAYFQINTNTHGDVRNLEKIYNEALDMPEVVGIAVSTRPDSVSDGVLQLLREIKEKKYLWLELGLQSANDRTLEAINRGHTALEFKDAALRASEAGLQVCAHVIIGLPGEDRGDIINTARFVGGLPLWGIKFHQLQVIKGTALEGLYNKGGVRLLDLEEYAEIVVECLEMLPSGLVIHRLCGDAPLRYLAAPGWGANKFVVIDAVTALMKKRGTRQGAKFSV